MAQNPDTVRRRSEESDYRCPGCGEMVDNSRMDEVLRHHQHVLQKQFPPPWFNVTGQPQRTVANAAASAARAETQAPLRRPSDSDAELQRRRYGH